MVGSKMLLQIHKRVQQLKGACRDTATFGGVSILAVGDLFQLQPVVQPHIFSDVHDTYARLHGSLWKEEFSMLELDELMRQHEDKDFAQLLCRVCTATTTEQDIKKLSSRDIKEDDPKYPDQSLHVFRLNKDVDVHNVARINNVAPEDQQVVIKVNDCTKDRHTAQQEMTMPKNKADTGGLVAKLCLAVGAKVMTLLTVNIDVSDGLVNGARGTVENIIKASNGEVTSVLVKFDHPRVGRKSIAQSHYRTQHPSAVPLSAGTKLSLTSGERRQLKCVPPCMMSELQVQTTVM